MIQGFQVLAEFNERAKADKAGDLSLHHIARFMRTDKLVPGIWLEVFDRERHATIFRINPGNNRFDLLAFFQKLTRMFYSARPRNVGNVDQTVDAFLNLNESAKVSCVAHTPLP